MNRTHTKYEERYGSEEEIWKLKINPVLVR